MLKNLPCEDLARSLLAPCKNVAKALLDRLLVAYLKAGRSMVASPTADDFLPISISILCVGGQDHYEAPLPFMPGLALDLLQGLCTE